MADPVPLRLLLLRTTRSSSPLRLVALPLSRERDDMMERLTGGE